MTITAKLADGTELQFPDGTAPEVIQRTVQNLLAQSKPQEEVIARIDDGDNGRVIRRADGSLAFVNAAMTTTDPAKIAEIMKGAKPGDISIAGFDKTTLDQAGGVAGLTKFVQGVPFAGQWLDEFVGKMAGPEAGQAVRATQSAMDRQNPVQSAALQLGGGIVGAVPMALAAAPGVAAAAPASIAGQVVVGGGAGLVSGAVEGAVSGAGAANSGDRGQGALTGAAVGGGLGFAAGVAGPLMVAGFKAGLKPAIDYLKQTDVTGIRSALGISSDAAKIIKAHLQSDDIAAAQAALDRAGPQAMIADSSPQASQLLDTTVAAGGPAQRIARDAVDGRANASAGRLGAAMDSVLGPAPGGLKAASKDIAKRTAASREAAYAKAYGSPIDYAADAGRAIEGVIARIPSKTFNAAVAEANDAMQVAGVQNMQIMASVDTAGKVTFTRPPNVQQLDFLKRSLDQIARDATDPVTGKMTGAGAQAASLAADLRKAVSDAVPSYSAAVRLGGDKIAEENALKIGRDLLKDGTTRETVAEVMKGASLEAQIAAKRGVRIAFDEAMANVKAVASDPETDARAAMAVIKQFSSPAARQKAVIVMGQEKADKLFAAFDEAATQLALRSNISRNSATAARTAGKAAMDSIIESPVKMIARGEVMKAARALVQVMTKSTPADQVAAQQKIYAEVAQALTGAKGADAKAALAMVQKASAGSPISEANASFIARTVAGALAGSSYLLGSQSQMPTGRAR